MNKKELKQLARQIASDILQSAIESKVLQQALESDIFQDVCKTRGLNLDEDDKDAIEQTIYDIIAQLRR